MLGCYLRPCLRFSNYVNFNVLKMSTAFKRRSKEGRLPGLALLELGKCRDVPRC